MLHTQTFEGTLISLVFWAMRCCAARRRTVDRVNGRDRTKFGNFESLYLRIYKTIEFKSDFIGIFVKFPCKITPWNWIWDEINMKIWNFSQKFRVRLLLFARSTVRRGEARRFSRHVIFCGAKPFYWSKITPVAVFIKLWRVCWKRLLLSKAVLTLM